MTLDKQKQYCKEKGLEMIAPDKCWGCRKPVEDSGTESITGCKHCNTSFCE